MGEHYGISPKNVPFYPKSLKIKVLLMEHLVYLHLYNDILGFKSAILTFIFHLSYLFCFPLPFFFLLMNYLVLF